MPSIKIINSSEIPESLFKTRSLGNDVHEIVAGILTDVKTNGDTALQNYAAKYDKASPSKFEIPKEHLKLCATKLKERQPDLYDALSYSFSLAKTFAQKQRECFTDFETELVPGIITGQKNIPVENAGLYVPAGRYPLLSTVIMCSAPAKAAGCKNVILCTPPRLHPNAKGDPESPAAKRPWADTGIMAAAYICGIDRVFAVGGAQAIGAMAYGTQSIPKCDVIVGPGNKFVAEAKRSIYGEAGIDMLAGPTEVFIIADDSANPAWVAADMLAQAEHDVDAQSILATTSSVLANAVATEIDTQLETLKNAETAKASIEKNGLIILCNSLDEATEIANKKAPEHLELALNESPELTDLINHCYNYGSLFIGHESAEVLGDYAGGLNHTLPTTGSARFTGGLSVRMFLKTVTTLRTQKKPDGQLHAGTRHSLEAAEALGKVEGLLAHAAAARIRRPN